MSLYSELASVLAKPCLGVVLLISACTSQEIVTGKPIPVQNDRDSINQVAKNDMDRMADIEMRENIQSLRILMTKLYKRNPQQLQKSIAYYNTQGVKTSSAEDMVEWVFTQNPTWQFASINQVKDTEALFLAFNDDYTGDRVLPFIIGLQTMLIKAHGGRSEHFLTDSIQPQSIYNVARNIEIAAWKLGTARDALGNLYLISNQITDQSGGVQNLSFEREFGKMIGRTDIYAITLAEKSQRLISRVVQSVTTLLFLPF